MQDDIRSHEQELARKERNLGPNHRDVADCLSNIAILYNQDGFPDKARPLYERALAIFEAAGGPKSQEVAHTLTDLAVLHLEAGRDEVGRPLLERALEIQRKNLGDDHPDVVAILDVLSGD
jgi:centrosomal protein CEP104